jgi:hypothetical protein
MFEAADPDVFSWHVKNDGPTSTCSSTTAKSSSSNAYAPASGALPTHGAACSATAGGPDLRTGNESSRVTLVERQKRCFRSLVLPES